MVHFVVPNKFPRPDIGPFVYHCHSISACMCEWLSEWTNVWMGPGQRQSTVACHYHLVLYPSINNTLQSLFFTIWHSTVPSHWPHISFWFKPVMKTSLNTTLNLRDLEFLQLCLDLSDQKPHESDGFNLTFSLPISLHWHLLFQVLCGHLLK